MNSPKTKLVIKKMKRKVREFLNNKLKMNPKSIKTETNHHTGYVKQKSGKRKTNCSEILKVHSYFLKGELTYVNEDLSELPRKRGHRLHSNNETSQGMGK